MSIFSKESNGNEETKKDFKSQLPQRVLDSIAENARRESSQKLRGRVSMAASLVVATGIWWCLAEFLLIHVPTPAETVTWSIAFVTDSWYYNSVLSSMFRVYVGFIIGIVLGTFIGLLMGWNLRFRNWSFPAADLLRHVPPVSWVPLTIIVAGSLTPAIVLIIFIGTFFSTALNSMLGVQLIDQSKFRAAKCLGASPIQVFRHILLPGALPSILYGMVLGMGLAWMSVVAGEMISGDYGIGYLAWQSYNLLRFPEIVLAMLTIGGLAYGSSEVVRYIVNKFLRWREVY